MTQYINLYDASLRPNKELLTLNNLAIAVGLAWVVLMGLAVYGMGRSNDEMQTYQMAEAKLRQAQEELTVFAAQQSGRKQDSGLVNELSETKRQLLAKTDVLARLRSGEFGQRSGFSPFFRSLASTDAEGVWLTAFDASAGGQSMEIRGRLLNESTLPRYVQALSRQPAFAGRQFSALNVSRVEAKSPDGAGSPVPAYVEFVLSGMQSATAPAKEGAR